MDKQTTLNTFLIGLGDSLRSDFSSLDIKIIVVQKYNHTNPVIDLDRLFSKNDLFELEKQVNSFDTSLRLSTFIRDEKIHFYSASDCSKRECIEFFLSYPLLNKDKNAIIVFLSYYGGLLCAGEDVLIYVKKSGKWMRLTKIWLSVS